MFSLNNDSEILDLSKNNEQTLLIELFLLDQGDHESILKNV